MGICMQLQVYDSIVQKENKEKELLSTQKKLKEKQQLLTDFEAMENTKEDWNFDFMTDKELKVILRLCFEKPQVMMKGKNRNSEN